MMTHIYIYATWPTPMKTYLFKSASLGILVPFPIGDQMMQSVSGTEIGKNIQGRLFDNRRTRLNQMEFMSYTTHIAGTQHVL